MTAPAIEDVLAEVNRLRAEHGLAPLDEMPKGERSMSSRCPLAVGLDSAGVGISDYLGRKISDEQGYEEHLLPPVLASFRAAFDAGLYPDLIEAGA